MIITTETSLKSQLTYRFHKAFSPRKHKTHNTKIFAIWNCTCLEVFEYSLCWLISNAGHRVRHGRVHSGCEQAKNSTKTISCTGNKNESSLEEKRVTLAYTYTRGTPWTFWYVQAQSKCFVAVGNIAGVAGSKHHAALCACGLLVKFNVEYMARN